MLASTASACFRRLSDWVYSVSKPQADSRVIVISSGFSLKFLPRFPQITTASPENIVDTALELQHIWAAFPCTSIELDANEREACSGLSQLGMATTLAPVDSREVIRCDRCQLV